MFKFGDRQTTQCLFRGRNHGIPPKTPKIHLDSLKSPSVYLGARNHGIPPKTPKIHLDPLKSPTVFILGPVNMDYHVKHPKST